MKNLIVLVNQVNETKGYRFGDDEPCVSRFETPGELYRSCLKEYGRCTSKMYIDTKEGKTMHVGWVFEKRMKYEDSNNTFTCATWVSVLKEMPEMPKIKYTHMNLKSLH